MNEARALYFASDLHLGVPDYQTSLQREKRFIQWLETIAQDAEGIYIVGDLFDFWFEYKRVVPKGYARLLGKLAELSDRGVSITVLAGNHDLGYKDYFPSCLGVRVFHEPQTMFFHGKKIFIAHGDGLGPGDYAYKIFKKVIRHSINKWLFEWLHPNLGISIAYKFSNTSRKLNQEKGATFLEEKEFIYQFARELFEQDNSYNYFIFGHRHIPIHRKLAANASFFLLGDWLKHNSYLKLTPTDATLEYFN
ncbi:MAG: UDP-2,3-diacylglucosamine diphosphatase [Bacteroidia bacterium]|nr:UDP-2,3-diacylglucosamine diphosphatase [Bacteroidia bacterium]MDW8158410.1 UDP-2,3-diacylglucosamine diphosphatase [Bacteroidia bacterium]